MLTAQGRPRKIVVDSAYVEGLESIARGHVLDAIDFQAPKADDMSAEMRERIDATQPTAKEIASDRGND